MKSLGYTSFKKMINAVPKRQIDAAITACYQKRTEELALKKQQAKADPKGHGKRKPGQTQ